LHLKGHTEQAQHDLDTLCRESIRSLLEIHDEYSIESIQSAFSEEKHRIEDIEEVTTKVIQALHSAPTAEQSSLPWMHQPETSISHSNTISETTHPQFLDSDAPKNDVGGLDLAGMIDGMLATEAQN
jgi:phosphoribosylanthranilate isomerase